MKINKSILVVTSLLLFSCDAPPEIDQQFTIAVIPDTQNYIDYVRQKNEGFGIDGADIFIEQMEYIAANTSARGGEIDFVTSVGDVWQNYDRVVDPKHYERGMRQIPFPAASARRMLQRPVEEINERVANFEVPMAKRGYDIIAETGVPFSVVPGNHDYDTWWRVNPFPDDTDPLARIEAEQIETRTHFGGYNTFNGAFGPDSHYFNNKNWYVSSYNGGVNSAQIFEAGGYRFLHFGFEMQAGDDVLSWAQSIIDQNPGLPTFMSTHDFLSPKGERAGSGLSIDDPDWHNNAEEFWNGFIKNNDQIFMVLSGHQPGQATRIDQNEAGNEVYQILSDYQVRHRTAVPPMPPSSDKMLGDGWMRLMNFDMSGAVPKVDVRTYSTYYKKYSIEMPEYASWYKRVEQPDMTDAEFNAADHFTIELGDFKKRFGEPQ